MDKVFRKQGRNNKMFGWGIGEAIVNSLSKTFIKQRFQYKMEENPIPKEGSRSSFRAQE